MTTCFLYRRYFWWFSHFCLLAIGVNIYTVLDLQHYRGYTPIIRSYNTLHNIVLYIGYKYNNNVTGWFVGETLIFLLGERKMLSNYLEKKLYKIYELTDFVGYEMARLRNDWIPNILNKTIVFLIFFKSVICLILRNGRKRIGTYHWLID